MFWLMRVFVKVISNNTQFKKKVTQHVLVFLGIKEFTNWPTIPQIFIGGEFIGGCDILLQMHKNGELIEELQKVGIQSTLLEQEKKEE